MTTLTILVQMQYAIIPFETPLHVSNFMQKCVSKLRTEHIASISVNQNKKRTQSG